VLEKLLDQKSNPGYEDPRNCLVFWARPPPRIRDLVNGIQERLLEVAPCETSVPPYHVDGNAKGGQLSG